MSDRLSKSAGWNRARALKLHEHFQAVRLARACGAEVGKELERARKLIDGIQLDATTGRILEISSKTMRREWDYWNAGGREGHEKPEHVRRPEALLCAYKPGCGGHKRMPRKLIAEFQRRLTLDTGGRDRKGKSPISVAWDSLKRDFLARKPLPGIDYDDFEVGPELPWHSSTACRNKPERTLRVLGNRGTSAHKNAGAYVSLNYSKLRKCELFTLDDVRLDIVCIDEKTGQAIEVVLYVFMEVSSRLIVDYVMKPAAAITQEDVDELVAHGLQTPGFGLGNGYTTHLLFERGTVACSDAAQALLEGVTDGNLKVHRTSVRGGVRWIGGPTDKGRGNACGKAVIESFNRWLHYSLLHLPGQRGNNFDNAPQGLGDMGGANFFAKPKGGKTRENKGTLIDQAEQLAQFEIASGRRLGLKLPMLYLFQLNEAVRDAIKRHNTEPGHAYRGHGTHHQAEVRPGVWVEPETAPTVAEADPAPGKRSYTLKGSPANSTAGSGSAMGKKEVAIYWTAWGRVAKARPDLDRHAITRRVLGFNKSHQKFSRAEWAQLLRAFAAIVREAKENIPF